ncbi:MAG: BrnA antitoxin family protein [Bryobacteraceae bacterium]
MKSTIRKSTAVARSKAGTDWNRFDALTDGDIRSAVKTDPDAAPILDANWFRRAKVILPEPKKAVSIRLDRDVMEWFQKQGTGYQTRINAVLKAYVDAHR